MKKRLNVVLDRFEENLVVLIDEKGEEIIFPKRCLPEDWKESDIIKIELSLNKKMTEKRKKQIKRLIDKLKKKRKE